MSAPAGNLVFGLTLLTRSRLWASDSSDPPKLGLLPPVTAFVRAINEET
jgi:hypothetical protein